ncbi:MAG: DUF3592 domain-containing protein [Spirochaetales bacterium]|nr:DUF3592 domain-containing protein [Spirochaetales bacterium]
MNAYKNASIVGIVLMLAGIGITIYGFSFISGENSLDENGVIVKGTVIDINKKDIYRSPIVRFKTKDNRTFTFLSPLDVNVDFFGYEIGQEVEVIYNKDDPTDAKINAFWERNVAQIFLLILGCFLIAFGLILWRVLLKKAKKYAAQ